MLSLDEGKALIEIARNSIKEELKHEKIEISNEIKQKYSDKRGVFVTLNKNNELRGCIGYIEPIMPLWEAVHNAAKNAGFSDPRFSPLGQEEFEDIKIEVSVLSLPELIKVNNPEEYLDNIIIGKHGLIVEDKIRGYKGLLLPQVFPEYNADAKKALEMTCEKAGLENNCWQKSEIKIYRFECQVFCEENGKTVEKKLY